MASLPLLGLTIASLTVPLVPAQSDGASHQPAAPETATGILPDTEVEDLLALYREFHRRPELSFREVETSKRLASELEAAGFTVTRRVGGLGVVAVLQNGDGPTVMVRADMDALPVGERTGLPYMSELRTEDADGRVGGIMHACGHDLHMANLVGTARWLSRHRAAWRGTVVCIGQPAEERSGGATAMLQDGLFERFPRPDWALALHVDATLPTGTVGYCAGPSMANVESVDITMFGRGGHGAAPHTTIDPIVQAAELVMVLQTIVSREVEPIEPAVVTVGSIEGGQKHNIIPDRCHLKLTVRSYRPEVHAQILAAIERKAKAVARGARAPEPKIELSEHTPALINDEELVARVVASFRRVLGDDSVVPRQPVMMAEDFGRYGRAGVPIFMFGLGSVDPERLQRYTAAGEPPPSAHSPFYYPDPDLALRTGIRAMTTAVCELLKP